MLNYEQLPWSQLEEGGCIAIVPDGEEWMHLPCIQWQWVHPPCIQWQWRMKLPSNYADCICRAYDCDGTMILVCKCNWLNLGWPVYSGNSFPINKYHILRAWFHTSPSTLHPVAMHPSTLHPVAMCPSTLVPGGVGWTHCHGPRWSRADTLPWSQFE